MFTLKWTGFEPGSAPELAALGLDRATNATELRQALGRWKLPVVDVVYADAAGVGHQVAGGPASAVRGPGLSGPAIFAANGSAARMSRLAEIFGGAGKYSIDDMKGQQHDVTSWNAEQLMPRLAGLRSTVPRVEDARRQLLEWNRRVTAGSPPAALYVAFERSLWRKISEARVPAGLLDDYLGLAGFDLAEAAKASNAVVLDALTTAVAQLPPRSVQVTFRHPLAITPAARRLFNVGPFEPGGYDGTVNAYFARSNVEIGASFREILDVAGWDRSVATSAPGQSEWPHSPHFSDLAQLWAAGEYFPLAFSDRAVQANTESLLVLNPR